MTEWLKTFARCSRFTLLAASLLLPFSNGFAATSLRIAAQETAEPMFVLLQRGDATALGGFCIDLLHAIERIEPDVKFIITSERESLVRIHTGLALGHLDAACALLRTEDRHAEFDFIEPALLQANFYLAIRADDKVNIRSWEDVRKLKSDGVVLLVNGHSLLGKLKDKEGLILDASARDPHTNIQKLLAGRGRFFFHHAPGIEEEIRNANAQGKVRLLPVVLDSQPMYMVLSKKLQPESSSRVQKAIARLHASGELKRLADKWNAR